MNGLAVVEFTHEFVSFYERLLHEYVEPLPAEVRFAVGVRHAHYEHEGEERKLYLAPGPIGDRYDLDQYDRHEAPELAFTDSVDIATSAEEPHLEVDKVSYELLRRFYNWFRFTDDAVPYTNEAHDAIDFAQIQNMRR